MKTNKLFLSITLFLFVIATNVKAQNLEGYTYQSTVNGVSLYYKVGEYGITFKVKNERNKMIHVKIYNVTSQWSDNRTRTKDVEITYIPEGQIRGGSYDHSDNYSKMVGKWSFDSWKWSERREDL